MKTIDPITKETNEINPIFCPRSGVNYIADFVEAANYDTYYDEDGNDYLVMKTEDVLWWNNAVDLQEKIHNKISKIEEINPELAYKLANGENHEYNNLWCNDLYDSLLAANSYLDELLAE